MVQLEAKTLPRANDADDWSRPILVGLGKSHSCRSCEFVPRVVSGRMGWRKDDGEWRNRQEGMRMKWGVGMSERRVFTFSIYSSERASSFSYLGPVSRVHKT